jgi:hypothetical protein
MADIWIKMADIAARELSAARLHPLGDAHDQVADAFEIGDAFQAGQQLAGAAFVDARDSARELLIDLALNLIEFLLAIADGEERHAGRVGQQILNIEGCVAGDQACFERHAHQLGLSSVGLGARLDGFCFFGPNRFGGLRLRSAGPSCLRRHERPLGSEVGPEFNILNRHM